MATRRKTPAPRPRRATRRASPARSIPRLNPDVTRSIVAVIFLVLGAVILVGLTLPGKGALTDWIVHVIAPWFGSGRWLLPFLLIGLGVYVERARGPRAGWGRTVVGATLAYVALLGILSVFVAAGLLEDRSGGRLGTLVADPMVRLVSVPGAFVVLLGVLVVGAVIALDRPVRELLAPVGRGAREIGAALVPPPSDSPAGPPQAAGRGPRAVAADDAASVRNGRGARDAVARPDIPTPLPAPAQVSSVFSGGMAAAAAWPRSRPRRPWTAPSTSRSAPRRPPTRPASWRRPMGRSRPRRASTACRR